MQSASLMKSLHEAPMGRGLQSPCNYLYELCDEPTNVRWRAPRWSYLRFEITAHSTAAALSSIDNRIPRRCTNLLQHGHLKELWAVSRAEAGKNRHRCFFKPIKHVRNTRFLPGCWKKLAHHTGYYSRAVAGSLPASQESNRSHLASFTLRGQGFIKTPFLIKSPQTVLKSYKHIFYLG